MNKPNEPIPDPSTNPDPEASPVAFSGGNGYIPVTNPHPGIANPEEEGEVQAVDESEIKKP